MAQDKLKEALSEIQLLKKEVQEECNERRNAERELHSALQKVYALLIHCASLKSRLHICLLTKS
jgi:hypothetical protein